MWAAIFGDFNNNKIYLSHDRYGKKPLYYYLSKFQFIISSEPRPIFYLLEKLNLSFSRTVNLDGISKFLFSKFTPFYDNHINFYSEVKAMPSNTNLVFDLCSFNIRKHSHIKWLEKDLSFNNISHLNEDELVVSIRNDLENSIKLRMGGDTKIGVMFSGGLDSGLLVYLIRKLFPKNQLNLYASRIYNQGIETEDTHFANNLAKKFNLPIKEVINENQSEKNLLDVIINITKISELPINYLMSTVTTHQIAKQMSIDGIKVSIDGTGGDEIMGGYPNSRSLLIANLLKGNLSNSYFFYKQWLKEYDFSFSEICHNSFDVFKQIIKKTIYRKKIISMNKFLLNNLSIIKNSHLKNTFKKLDTNFYSRNELCSSTERQFFEIFKYQLPFYLGTSDIVSMANSVENRSPFLDFRLIKYLSISEKNKNRNGYNKYLMRKIFPNDFYESYVLKEKRWNRNKL